MKNDATLVGQNQICVNKENRNKRIKYLKIDNFAFEGMEIFNHQEFILNAEHKMNKNLLEKVKGNKTYYAKATLINSKFLKKITKKKIYKTMERPVVGY
jgi:hypothetical protein